MDIVFCLAGDLTAQGKLHGVEWSILLLRLTRDQPLAYVSPMLKVPVSSLDRPKVNSPCPRTCVCV